MTDTASRILALLHTRPGFSNVSDILKLLPGVGAPEIARAINELVERGAIEPENIGWREYEPGLSWTVSRPVTTTTRPTSTAHQSNAAAPASPAATPAPQHAPGPVQASTETPVTTYSVSAVERPVKHDDGPAVTQFINPNDTDDWSLVWGELTSDTPVLLKGGSTLPLSVILNGAPNDLSSLTSGDEDASAEA